MRSYSLRKLKHHTYQLYRWYLRHGKEFPENERVIIEQTFINLDRSLLAKNRGEATALYNQLEAMINTRKERPFWKYPLELLGALAFALAVATLIRQTVFEFYEIPSGSMRPTFKEKDHLVVSKTSYGINIPLTPGHFYFDEDLLPRGGVVVFSGEGIDMSDTDTRYFWLFPAKKRYIKRCMAKPYDSVYFYGGLIYAVDKEGNDLKRLREPPFNTTIDHVPFNTFEGRPLKVGGTKSDPSFEILYKQFNKPLGKLVFSNKGETQGYVFNGKEFVKDQVSALNTPHNEIKTYSDYFGIANYAMARLLNKEEMAKLHPEVKVDSANPLYLELAYAPRLAPIGSNVRKEGPIAYTGQLAYETSLIPLTSKEIEILTNNLYTARFTVKDGRAHRFDALGMDHYDVPLPNVPNGTYEFYDGQAFEIGFLGYRTELPRNHPLYQFTLRSTQAFFNNGMEFVTYFNPTSSYYAPFPYRFAFFRNGDLYVLGRKFLDKENPTLVQFVKNESKKSIPFVDRGPPMKEGKIDVDFIRTFGYTLGEKEYLALGDNYAMSADSRMFGPVPEANLEGSPLFVFWPPQERFGSPNQIAYPSFTKPTLIMWSIFLGLTAAFLIYEERKKSLPIFKHGI